MITNNFLRPTAAFAAALAAGAFLVISGCSNSTSSGPANATKYTSTNLVADNSGFAATKVDPNLTNAWGLAIGPTGIFYVSANHSSILTTYDSTGATKLDPITIPTPTAATGGAPTGMIYNSTADFVIPGGATARFIVASEDGIIVAWASGTASVKVADRSAVGAVYKGLAIAIDGAQNFLYAADFTNRRIDVFDSYFTLVTTKPFADTSIPSDYGPFNIQNIDGSLYVTYAKQKGPDFKDDQSGLGYGYVNVFRPNGTLIRRLVSQGALNSPWGLAKAPAGFGDLGGSILVGNFGDGLIHAYSQTGTSMGALADSTGYQIKIDGLWALFFPSQVSGQRLYFTAGPNGENDGLFGYIRAK